MTTEKLEKANGLKKQINELRTHIEWVSKANGTDANYCDEFAKVTITPKDGEDGRKLRNSFLPIVTKTYMAIYISNVGNEIKRLEKEFENL